MKFREDKVSCKCENNKRESSVGPRYLGLGWERPALKGLFLRKESPWYRFSRVAKSERIFFLTCSPRADPFLLDLPSGVGRPGMSVYSSG